MPVREKPPPPNGFGSLLSRHLESQGVKMEKEYSPRGFRSPITKYMNEHWEELRDPAGKLVGGLSVVPKDVVGTAKNSRQAMRQSILSVVSHRYGPDKVPAEGTKAVTVRQVIKEDVPGYVVAMALELEDEEANI